MRRVLATIVLATIVLAGTIAVESAAPTGAVLPAPPAEPQPRAWILVDAGSGDVLAASNEHEAMLVASTVKLMTALAALQRLPTDATLTVTDRAATRPAISMGMQVGQQWPMLQVLSSLLIVSANDAAYVLAESAGGSAEAFAEQMGDTGERLGLRDSTFADPAGLDDEFSLGGGSRMSAYDLAIVGRNALAVPAIAERASNAREVFDDPTGTTRILNTKNDVFLGQYDGATGLKTGGTEAAGSTLVASATRDGRTLVAVVLGVPDTAAWAGALLDQGFSGTAAGTGETLPPVRAVTADQIRSAVDGMPALLGRPPIELGAVPDATDASGEAAPRPTAPVEESPAAAGPVDAVGGDGGTNWTTVAAAILLVLLVALAFLRRRAVIRRRRRRLARQRALSEARRRGMIDVIDPTEMSRGHVQVRRESGPR